MLQAHAHGWLAGGAGCSVTVRGLLLQRECARPWRPQARVLLHGAAWHCAGPAEADGCKTLAAQNLWLCAGWLVALAASEQLPSGRAGALCIESPSCVCCLLGRMAVARQVQTATAAMCMELDDLAVGAGVPAVCGHAAVCAGTSAIQHPQAGAVWPL